MDATDAGAAHRFFLLALVAEFPFLHLFLTHDLWRAKLALPNSKDLNEWTFRNNVVLFPWQTLRNIPTVTVVDGEQGYDEQTSNKTKIHQHFGPDYYLQ